MSKLSLNVEMKLNKTPSYWLASGIIFLIILKSFIRPYWLEAPDGLKFLMGILPNLLGSFLLIYGIRVFDRYLYFFYDRFLLRCYCLLCMTALTLNEYLQLIPVFMRTFDYFDIAASVLGLSTGYGVISFYYSKSINAKMNPALSADLKDY